MEEIEAKDTREMIALPKAVYVWEKKTRKFKQIEGRETHAEDDMIALYADLAHPKGWEFEMPHVLKGER